MKINSSNVIPTVPKNQPAVFKGSEVKSLGEITKNSFKNLVSLDRSGTMNRNLFIVNAFAFLLGTRLVTSRDNDEKREIFVRDIPSILIAVAGVPTIQTLSLKKLQPKSGFAFTDVDKKPERSDFSKWLHKTFNITEKPLKEKMSSNIL